MYYFQRNYYTCTATLRRTEQAGIVIPFLLINANKTGPIKN